MFPQVPKLMRSKKASTHLLEVRRKEKEEHLSRESLCKLEDQTFAFAHYFIFNILMCLAVLVHSARQTCFNNSVCALS